MKEWWRKSAVYQIYPKSFNDTTGTGVGDIKGIIDKLDYLKTLGIDVIWLTPIYESPQRDNGYDISDYYAIDEEFGTMEDFECLLNEAHGRGIKVIMDLVVNHTSTDHEWFRQSRMSKDNPYRDYYIWKDPENGREPANWISKFGGPAWELDEKTGQYYLHLFDVTQADLNWENKKVRKEIYDMMHYWFGKGIDGFRLDVINLISKNQDFPDDDGSIAPGDGRKFYTDGPRVHEFLHEMNTEVLTKYDSMTVGEMSSTSIEDCIRYSNPASGELSMTFNFHHLKVDYPNGEKWALGELDFPALKSILTNWQTKMQEGGGWNALFWCNHDQPRIVSRFGDDKNYPVESAKMLATSIHMLQGTPYIYQGEEIGMANPHFNDIKDYRDVETLNYYEIMKEKGIPEALIMEIIKQKSRDNSRTPVQWNDSVHGGFTEGTPWIPVPSSYKRINAEKALADPDSVFYHYQKLIKLRKKYDIITEGSFELLYPEHKELFVYKRQSKDEVLLVINNFYAKEAKLSIGKEWISDEFEASTLLSNYKDAPAIAEEMIFRPYESIIYHFKKK
ncbi:alpha,alpha-phosphotrehalase [Bacillus sp. MUM 13]|uniref:alpha,alpha-phosphotrehalase n=1 Tax=Bacillus sp. MUM 13 TaxID=1678001 RepID=UPI0008F585FD|nr:alpha,alpha-phosphotrehalase [Bacillus sp. MUM 13]OIK07932.1 alpha,alpha-phosphotrehalase [Bacillus sp. MUM 13]